MILDNLNSVKLIGAFCILISSLLASSIIVRNYLAENDEKKSNFYLEKSLVELNNVYDLLKDRNNDRVTWILAARIIKTIDMLSKKIEYKHHKEVFELQKFQVQHKIRDILKHDDGGLPVAFFAGFKDWEIIKASEAIKETSDILVNNQLAENSILIIFDFIKYPNDYEDPLENVNKPRNLKELENWRKEGGNTGITLDVFMYLKNRFKIKS